MKKSIQIETTYINKNKKRIKMQIIININFPFNCCCFCCCYWNNQQQQKEKEENICIAGVYLKGNEKIKRRFVVVVVTDFCIDINQSTKLKC